MELGGTRMKKVFKLGLVLLVLGIILVIIGLVSGQDKSVFFKDARPVLYSKYEAQKYHTLNQEIPSSTTIKDLVLDINNANLVIKSGEKYSLKYQGWGNQPTINVVNGILNIKASAGGQDFINRALGLFLNFKSDLKKDTLILTVPTDVKFSSVRLISGGDYTAKVNLTELKSQKFELVGSVDEVNLESCNFETTNIDISGSTMNLNNTILLNGKLTLLDIDLKVSASTLKDIALINDTGDIEYSNVSIDGGNLNTTDSYLKISNSSIANGYTIVNQRGQTEVLNTSVDGYKLMSDSDDSTLNLFGKTGSLQLNQNPTATNRLEISTQQDGSIIVK